MTNPITDKVSLFASLKDIQHDGDIPAGFTCLGKIDEVYPEYAETDYYRTWIWQNAEGIRIATWDTGNSYCSFMCEGTLDGLNAHFAELEKIQRETVAAPGNIVMFSEKSAFAHIPNLCQFSHRVETSTEEGVTLNGFTDVFPHESYIVNWQG